ncbi:6562_t:CDS:2 [Entrophospora sp. SA101]|nr:6562_t:CDS:2 [Entrophospora sp. SA101]
MSVLESMVEAINEQNVAIKNFESEYEDYKNKLKTLQDYKNKLINKKLGLKQDIIQANKLIEDAKNYYTEDDLNRFSKFIEQPMKNLRARKNLMILLLIDQNYYDTLLCLIAILKESQRLINEISFLWNLRKFRATNDIKIHFERVTEEFDKVLSKLNLEKPFDYEAQKKKDLKAIEYDISTMNKFLESVEGSSITLPNSNMEINPIFETVTLIKARLTEVNPNEITIKRIPPNELIRIYHHLCRKNDQPGGGGNVKVKRWLCGEKGKQSYSGIIRAAWQNDPLLRPYLYLIFLKLDELSKDNPIEEGSSLSAMLRFQKYDDSDQVVEIIYDDNEVETKNEEEILPVNKDSNLDIVPVVSIYLALNFVLQL